MRVTKEQSGHDETTFFKRPDYGHTVMDDIPPSKEFPNFPEQRSRRAALDDEFRHDKSRLDKYGKYVEKPVRDPYGVNDSDGDYDLDGDDPVNKLSADEPADDFYDDYEDFYDTDGDVDSRGRKKFASGDDRYLSDEDITAEFNGFETRGIEVSPSGNSGWIELYFPNGGESVGGGAQELTDHWFRDNDGRIAFDNWYPDDVTRELVSKVKEKLAIRNSSVASKVLGYGDPLDDRPIYDKKGRRVYHPPFLDDDDNNKLYVDELSDGDLVESLDRGHKRDFFDDYEEFFPHDDAIADENIYDHNRFPRGVASNSGSDFTPQGTYTISNSMGYLVEISDDGDYAKLKNTSSGEITKWLPIEYVYDEDLSEDKDDLIPVIDPKDYNIPLDLVMRISSNSSKSDKVFLDDKKGFESGLLTAPDAPDASDKKPITVDSHGNVEAGTDFQNKEGQPVDRDGNMISESGDDYELNPSVFDEYNKILNSIKSVETEEQGMTVSRMIGNFVQKNKGEGVGHETAHRLLNKLRSKMNEIKGVPDPDASNYYPHLASKIGSESRNMDGTGPRGEGPMTGRRGGVVPAVGRGRGMMPNFSTVSPEQVVANDPDGADSYEYAMHLVDGGGELDNSVLDMLQNGVINKDTTGDYCRAFADEVPGADIGRLERAIDRLAAAIEGVESDLDGVDDGDNDADDVGLGDSKDINDSGELADAIEDVFDDDPNEVEITQSF